MSDRISLVNQIWPNKRRDEGETGRNARENGGPREQLRFVRALACWRAVKKSVRAKEAETKGCGKREETGRRTNLRSFESSQLEEQAERGEGKKVGKKGLFELSLCAKQPPGFSGTRQTWFPFLLLRSRVLLWMLRPTKPTTKTIEPSGISFADSTD